MSHLARGRNVIDNGNFNVWQRGATFTTPAVGAITADRWAAFEYTDGTVTITRDTAVPTLGSQYSLKVACTGTDGSLTAGQICAVYQQVEAQNHWDLLAGRPWVLSFWVKSYQTGTFCVGIRESANSSASIGIEYTINASATWEKKVIQIPLCSIGTWTQTANAASLQLLFVLASDPDTYKATNNTWSTSTNYYATTNQVNFMSSTDNYIHFAQVQLEAGTDATGFDAIMYADELARCRRYLQIIGTGVANERQQSGMAYSNNLVLIPTSLIPPMRAVPTLTLIGSVGNWYVAYGSSTSACTSVSMSASSSANYAVIQAAPTGTPLTAATAVQLLQGASSTNIEMTAEI